MGLVGTRRLGPIAQHRFGPGAARAGSRYPQLSNDPCSGRCPDQREITGGRAASNPPWIQRADNADSLVKPRGGADGSAKVR